MTQHSSNAVPKDGFHIPSWVSLWLGFLVFLLIWGLLINLSNTKATNLPEFQTLDFEQFSNSLKDNSVARMILEPWLRWDTAWYLRIAKFGYPAFEQSLAFAPLYPIMVSLIGKILGGEYLLGSLVISWSAFFGCCMILEKNIFKHSEGSTSKGIRAMLFFPTALFFFAGYSESLFFLLLLISWQFGRQGRWPLVGISGALAVLTRFFGIILVLPFFAMWWQQHREKKTSLLTVLWLGIMPLALVSWFEFTLVKYGSYPTTALSKGWALHADWPWVGIVGNLNTIFSQSENAGYTTFLNLIVVIIASISVIWCYKKKYLAEIILIISFLFVSLTKVLDNGLLTSTSRYILPVFPMYAMLGESFKHPIVGRILQYSSLVLLLLNSWIFFSWKWLA